MKKGIIVAAACALVAAAPSLAHGAVRVEERSQLKLEGAIGKIASLVAGGAQEPELTTTTATASRKVRIAGRSGEIVDLEEGAIYHLDLKAGTYTVATFEDLRRRLEAARREAAGAERRPEPRRPEARPSRDPNAGLENLQIDVELKSTGRTRSIAGFDAREVVMRVTAHEKGTTIERSGGLAVTSSMWLAKKIAALRDLEAFDQRFARKLAGTIFGAASAEGPVTPAEVHPMLKDVLVRMKVEGEKLDGSRLLTTTTVELVPSAEQLAELRAAQQRKAEARRERGRPQLGKGVGGLLGGLVSKAVEKKVEERVEPVEDESPNARLLTMTDEVVRISTSVSPADLALPPGLRRVR